MRIDRLWRFWWMALIVALLAGPAAASPAHVELAKQRARQLERLAEYRRAGAITVDARGNPRSVFRDAGGRLCPMAYLIAASGRRDLVDHVARTNNTLQLADVTEGPLWDWMQTSGLTREEIIRIQGVLRVGYDFERPVERPRGPVIVAERRVIAPPSPARLKRQVIRRLEAIERELAMHGEVSLAIAASRLPPGYASSAATRSTE